MAATRRLIWLRSQQLENEVMGKEAGQEAAPNKQRLHPLLTAAAVSVTIFSAVGVGALTGLLPISHSSNPQGTPELVSKVPDSAPEAAPAPETAPAPEATRSASDMPPAAPVATPAKKPVHKKVARHKPASAPVKVAESQPASPQAVQPSPVPPPPPAAPVEAPKPGVLGVVESVREISEAAKTSNGIGPIVGGIAGALLGNQFGHGNGRSVMTVAGAAGGALLGTKVEKDTRGTKHWEILVRLDDGTTRTLTSQVAPFWHGGERVRMIDGKLQPA
jgi:outer membrane lipoprotein SlyB